MLRLRVIAYKHRVSGSGESVERWNAIATLQAHVGATVLEGALSGITVLHGQKREHRCAHRQQQPGRRSG